LDIPLAEIKAFPSSDRTKTVQQALEEMALETSVESVLLIGELPDGGLTLMSSAMTVAQANWLIDRAKGLLLYD
jgi:predicted DNA-binding ribbon-helix-helix protein